MLNGRHIRLQQQQQLTCSLSVSLSIRLTNETQIIEAMVLKTAEGQAAPINWASQVVAEAWRLLIQTFHNFMLLILTLTSMNLDDSIIISFGLHRNNLGDFIVL